MSDQTNLEFLSFVASNINLGSENFQLDDEALNSYNLFKTYGFFSNNTKVIIN